MIVLTATCKNGAIALNHPLPNELEGKRVKILVEEIDEQSESDRDLVLGASRLSAWFISLRELMYNVVSQNLLNL